MFLFLSILEKFSVFSIFLHVTCLSLVRGKKCVFICLFQSILLLTHFLSFVAYVIGMLLFIFSSRLESNIIEAGPSVFHVLEVPCCMESRWGTIPTRDGPKLKCSRSAILNFSSSRLFWRVGRWLPW